MPRFFFDLEDHDICPDEEGTDLPDVDTARREGVKLTGLYLRDHPEIVWDGRELRTIVKDAAGSIKMTIVTQAFPAD